MPKLGQGFRCTRTRQWQNRTRCGDRSRGRGVTTGAWGLVRKEATIGNRALAGAAVGGAANLARSSLRIGIPSQTFKSFVGPLSGRTWLRCGQLEMIRSIP